MKKYILLFAFFILLKTPFSIACSCIYTPTFCETIADSNGNITRDLIVKATVLNKFSDGVEVKIDHILFGDVALEEVFINSGNGADCSVITSSFEEGESYVFVFLVYNNTFRLSDCEISYLKIENGIAKGPIAPGIDSWSYDDLSSIENCGENLNLLNVKNALEIYPNPTNEILIIKNISDAAFEQTVNIEVGDILGRTIRQLRKAEGFEGGEEWIINVSDLASGVYLFKITDSTQKVIYKIVKQG